MTSTPKVRRLSTDLASRIAAGEVVERPASVVKELLENAMDAGAGRIDIEVERGGQDLIRIRDDGHGMSPEDARLALERHATSKLKAFEDLYDLGSFGFRGEALPSIASVSRFRLQTRREGDEGGIELSLEGSGEAQERPCGLAVGTVVEVRDLFFNVPARRKFLKSEGTEAAHVAQCVEAMALAEPELTLSFKRNGRLHRQYLRAESRADRVRSVLRDQSLAHVAANRDALHVEALLSPPNQGRSSAQALRLFVNGRAVRDRLLLRSIAQAFGKGLAKGRYPHGVVYVDLPSEQVDVNVHPQKAEVRFAQGNGVAQGIFQLLSRELAKTFGGAVQATGYQPKPLSSQGIQRQLGDQVKSPWQWQGAARGATDDAHSKPVQAAAPATSAPLETRARPGKRQGVSAASPETNPQDRLATHLGAKEQTVAPSGQAPTDGNSGRGLSANAPPNPAARANSASGAAPSGTPLPQRNSPGAAAPPTRPEPQPREPSSPYSGLTWVGSCREGELWVVEREGVLQVLDPIVASEMLWLHKLTSALLVGPLAGRPLVFPATLPLTNASKRWLPNLEPFHQLGFELRPLGPESLGLHQVPAVLGPCDAKWLGKELLQVRPVADEPGESLRLLAEHLARVWAKKQGGAGSSEEIHAQLKELGQLAEAPARLQRRLVVGELGIRDFRSKGRS